MVEVKKGIKVRICPTDEQKELFHRNFGCCRKTYNTVLDKYNKAYEKDNKQNPTESFLNKLLNETKNEFPYLKDVESTNLQQVTKDLSRSYSNFFKKPQTFHTSNFSQKKG